MVTFVFPGQGNTLASALRTTLEHQNPDEFVRCALLHPQDPHLTVTAPSEGALRRALQEVKDRVSALRSHLLLEAVTEAPPRPS